MAISERIHFFRLMRGMTQKYLGTAIGFPEKSADVRLAQYETGTRKPKADLTNALAQVLDAIQGEQAQRQSALTDAEKLLLSDAYVMPLYRQMVTITTDTAKVSGWSVSADGTLWFGSAAPAEK